METVLQLITAGMLLGGVYCLAALGIAITFGVLRILNLAHGEFVMLGALGGYLAFHLLGINPFISVWLVLPISGIIGALYYSIFLARLNTDDNRRFTTSAVLITLGTALVIEDLATFMWEIPVAGISYYLDPIQLGNITISSTKAFILLVVSLLLVIVVNVLKKTDFGLGVRAIIQCPEGARIVGIRIPTVIHWTFALGAALAGSAGVFYATLFTFSPNMGLALTLKYLCITVLGGVGSMPGLIAAGMGLGCLETLTAYYLGSQWASAAAYVLFLVAVTARSQQLTFSVVGE